MALNLSTLTNPATSASILNEALTTADLLDPVPILKNLSRGSNKGGDAKQTVALNQPKALPLIDGDGYLYCSGVSGNYATTLDDSSLDITGDLVIDVDVTMKSWTPAFNSSFCGKYLPTGDQRSFRFVLRPDKKLQFYFSDDGTASSLSGVTSTVVVPFSNNQRGQVRVAFNSSNGIFQFFTSTDKGQNWTQLGDDRTQSRTSIFNSTADVFVGAFNHNAELLNDAAIHSVKFYDSVTPSSSSLRFNCDFTATNVRHGDTKFACATSQVVTINQDSSSSNDVATIIKKPVLRFSSATSDLRGLFANQIDSGYMFAAFSVLGTGVEASGSNARVFSVNKTAVSDANITGAIFSLQNGPTTNLRAYAGAHLYNHEELYDDANGDLLHESKIANGVQFSKVNDADVRSSSLSRTLEADEFNIATGNLTDVSNAAIDLEFLALFSPATVPDEATATKIRDYINKRNQIYLRHQTDGFYFFNPQKLAAGDVTSWNGNITGSDLGDTDVATNVTIVQGSQTSQPNADGYSLTFEDNTQHLEWASAYTPNFPAGQTKAWQIVGTSLGTFAYLTQGSVTELNLLGNLGNASFRKAGDLYGIILLPESATGADIEEARKLLIDRGASDGATSGSYFAAWYARGDMVEFGSVDLSEATSLDTSWGSSALVKFSPTDISNCTNFSFSWSNCTSLNDFAPIQAPLGSNFASAWKSCSSLQSFPAGAKLGTSAANVNFTDAWRDSGLQSFPALDLSAGATLIRSWFYTPLVSFGAIDASNSTNFSSAWHGTGALTSFPQDAKLGTSAQSVNFTAAWKDSGLTSFSTPVPTANICSETWRDCDDLVSFDLEEIPLATNTYACWFGDSSLISFSTALPSTGYSRYAWTNCTSLTDFSADVFNNWNPSVISSLVFDSAWNGCTSLTAESVENILTSIDASGQYATSDGDAYVNGVNIQLTDAGIDIAYNTATGSLSAATNAAVDSLKAKGWSIIVNNVTL